MITTKTKVDYSNNSIKVESYCQETGETKTYESLSKCERNLFVGRGNGRWLSEFLSGKRCNPLISYKNSRSYTFKTI